MQQQGGWPTFVTFVPLKWTRGNRSSFWVWSRSQNQSDTWVCTGNKNRITGLNGVACCLSLPQFYPVFFQGAFFPPGHLVSSGTCHLPLESCQSLLSGPLPFLFLSPTLSITHGECCLKHQVIMIPPNILLQMRPHLKSLTWDSVSCSNLSLVFCPLLSIPARADTLPNLVQGLFIAISVFVGCPCLGQLPISSPPRLWETL